MLRAYLITLLCLVSLFKSSSAEYFSATVELNKALDAGKLLASDLTHYLELEEKRLSRIKRLANRLENQQGTPAHDVEPEDYFGNPVNAYVMVNRLAVDWKSELVKLIDQELANEALTREESSVAKLSDVLADVEEHANMLPGYSDVDGAADAILRLQDVYQLQASNLAVGIVTDDDTTAPSLTAAQCVHIGKQAYNKQEYLRAEEWFRVAYDRLWNDNRQRGTDQQPSYLDEPQPTVSTIFDHLAYSLGRQGRYAEALNLTRRILEMEPQSVHILGNIAFYEERLRAGEGIIGPAPKPTELSQYDKETSDYEAVCRGDIRFPLPKSNLFYCRNFVPHEYYLIGPIHEELLYPDPKIVMWYDLIHPGETKRLQELATPKLRRATVKNPITGQLEFAFYRTSKNAWLPDDLDEITHRLNRRIHMVTGLNQESSEDLQVGNYGIGGHYAPHFDFGRKREKDAFDGENGNRIATIIFYMTNVKAGGATAFNRIGARVLPIKGAAAFWWNLYPSGEGDLRTRHAACPVLVGSKWVTNVWFHYGGQEKSRPCELERGPIEVDDGF